MTHWLAALASNKSGPDEVSIGELELYCREHPYCQVAQMLLAVALKKAGRDTGGVQEQRSLAYAPDRQQFMGHLNRHGPKQEQPAGTQLAPGTHPGMPGMASLFFEGVHLVDTEVAGSQDDPSHEKEILSGKQQKQQQLIDRFLAADPRIVPDKEAFAEDYAGSPQEDEELEVISETLAEILVSQGKTDKALGIYEKLCLKYPEKSSYFAKKIETLKNEPDN
jgi:hypothetical protein